MTKIGRMACSV